MRRCTTHALYRSKLWQQDYCQHPQNANPDGSTCPGWRKQSFRVRLGSLVWFQMRAIACHLTSSKSAWKSTPKCTWMHCRVWWSPGAISWLVADPGCGCRTQHRPTSPKISRLGFRRSATTLYPSLTGPLHSRHEPAGLLRVVIRREHHQHDLPQNHSQPDRRHPPSIRRASASAFEKGMLPVPDPYGQAKAGRPARTYIQQLCENTGCSPEDLLKVLNDRERWRERVKDIRASGTTGWWWCCYI